MADAIAIEGLRLLKLWLPVAVAERQNLETRSQVMTAASMGGTSYQKGLGAIHSLSHPIGSIYGFHHGMTNAVLLPYVVAANRSAIGEKTEHLARCLDLPTSGGNGTDRVLTWLLVLREKIGVPNTLAELGVNRKDFPRITEAAIKDPTAPTNPVPVSAGFLTAILEAAWKGRR